MDDDESFFEMYKLEIYLIVMAIFAIIIIIKRARDDEKTQTTRIII